MLTTTAELSVLFLTLLFILIFLKFFEKRKLLNGFSGPKGFPLVGNFFDISKGSILESEN
jgi:hypothetical protein